MTDYESQQQEIVRFAPVQIRTKDEWKSISAGGFHSLALKKDGTLWAWGVNKLGQVGDRTKYNRFIPVQIGEDDDWTSIAAGFSHSLGLRDDGTIWGWGWNVYGQLGDDTRDNGFAPYPVGEDDDWKEIAAGFAHSLALKKDGTLWAWGSNGYGQLGIEDDSPINILVPVQVGTDDDWKTITAGGRHSLALKKDGTLWAWGWNAYGQLGLGEQTDVNVYSPLQIGIYNDWKVIAGGSKHSIALKKDGSLWAWGSNGYGQLGLGEEGVIEAEEEDEEVREEIIGETKILVPVLMETDLKWKKIAAGGEHSLAIDSDGVLWTWGRNNEGQLGGGTIKYMHHPIEIALDIKWTDVATGGYHLLAIEENKTIWAWGRNIEGQLGGKPRKT